MATVIYSPKIKQHIVILSDKDPPLGCIACYSPKEIEMLEGTKPEDLAVINEHKILWNLKEGEWNFDTSSRRFKHPNAVPEVHEGETDKGVRQAAQSVLPLSEIEQYETAGNDSKPKQSKARSKRSESGKQSP